MSSTIPKPIYQAATINLPTTSTRIETGQQKINSLFNYLNLSLNDPNNTNSAQSSQPIMGPLHPSTLLNKVVNPMPMNVNIKPYSRQFNYFDNDLLPSNSTDK